MVAPGAVTPATGPRERRRAERRLRDAVWHMQASDDIAHVVATLAQCLRDLGLRFHHCGVNAIVAQGPSVVSASPVLQVDGSVRWVQDPGGGTLARIWRERRTAYRPDLQAADPYAEAADLEHGYGRPIRSVVDAPFSHGTVAVNSEVPHAFDADAIAAIEGLAEVLEEAFHRRDDLRLQEQRQQQLEAEVAQRHAAESALRQALDRERLMGRIRDHILGAADVSCFSPALEREWLDDLRELGLPAYRMSLQLPPDNTGEYAFRWSLWPGHGAATETDERRLHYPWVREAWASGQPVCVDRERLTTCGFWDDQVQAIVEVPMVGGGSLGVSSLQPDAFDDAAVATLQTFAGLLSVALQRQRDLRALEERGRRYRELFESSPNPIWEEDFSAVKAHLDGLTRASTAGLRHYLEQHPEQVAHLASLVRIVDVNQASVAFFGLADKDAVDRRLPDYFGPESLPVFREELLALAGGALHFAGEIPIRVPGGGVRDLMLWVSVAPESAQSWSQVLVTFVDNTERKQAALRLAQDHQREAVMGRISAQILALTSLPELVAQLAGPWLDELRRLALPVYRLSIQTPAAPGTYTIPVRLPSAGPRPAGRQYPLSECPWVAQAWGTGQPVTVDRRRLTEAGFGVEAAQALIEVPFPGGGGSLGVTSTLADAFDERAVRALQQFAALVATALQRLRDLDALRESQAQLAAIVRTVPDIIYRLDAAGRVTFINDAVRRYGYAPAEMLGQRLLDFVHPRDRVTAQFRLNERRTGERRTRSYGVQFLCRSSSADPGRGAAGAAVPVVPMAIEAEGLYASAEPQTRTFMGTQGVARDVSDRQRADDALRESERFARSTVDALSAHLAIIDEHGTILAVNQAWRNYALANGGDLRTAAEGANYLAVCDAANGPDASLAHECARGIRAVLAGAQDDFALEYACHGPQDARWYTVHVTRFPGAGPTRLVVAHENVTPRRLAEEAVRERERRLSTLISNLPGVAYRCRNDPNWTMEHLSGSVKELTGYTPEDLLGNRTVAFSDLVPPDWREPLWLRWQEVLAQRQPFEEEYPLLTASGETRWVWERGRGVFDANGELLCLEGYILDVTERHRSAEVLRESREQFAKVFYRSPALMWLSRLDDGCLLEVNDQFCAVTGFNREDAIGRTAVEIGLQPAPGGPAGLAQAGAQDVAAGVEVSLRARNGAPLRCVCRGEVVVVGGEQQLLTLALDVTEQRRVTAELERQRVRAVQVDRLQALGEMATSIAHELNQPLNGIRAFAEGILLAPRMGWTPTAAEANQAFIDIVAQVDRISEIIDHMRVFARDDSERSAETFDIRRCVAGALKLMGAQLRVHGITLEDQSAGDTRPCEGWPNAIEQVILNLLSNARDALDDRRQQQQLAGRGPDPSWQPKILLRVAAGADNTVNLMVEDNGGGIDEAALPRVFEPFFTTKAVGKGTGIGLPISRAIIERHHGSIAIDNRPGDGVTVRVCLPAAGTAAPLPVPTATPQAAAAPPPGVAADGPDAADRGGPTG